MAYISQQEKKEIAPVVKGILKEYGLKGTLSIDNHSENFGFENQGYYRNVCR